MGCPAHQVSCVTAPFIWHPPPPPPPASKILTTTLHSPLRLLISNNPVAIPSYVRFLLHSLSSTRASHFDSMPVDGLFAADGPKNIIPFLSPVSPPPCRTLEIPRSACSVNERFMSTSSKFSVSAALFLFDIAWAKIETCLPRCSSCFSGLVLCSRDRNILIARCNSARVKVYYLLLLQSYDK